ncbi:hypothetical protein BDZ97DRAFT_1837267 [Flammula alnicola]|nr:hypothetical protein BDZ97DRAFT_1837267 [Flammula alnicola]
MQFKSILFVVCQVIAVMALERGGAPVFTAKKVYHTIIDQSPYLVDRTTTIVWTESASISGSSLPTAAPTPTIVY